MNSLYFSFMYINKLESYKGELKRVYDYFFIDGNFESEKYFYDYLKSRVFDNLEIIY